MLLHLATSLPPRCHQSRRRRRAELEMLLLPTSLSILPWPFWNRVPGGDELDAASVGKTSHKDFQVVFSPSVF